MTASNNLSAVLFHGSAHAFKPGEVIEPRNHAAAFATTSHETAKAYASVDAEHHGVLMGMTYEVEPVGEYTMQADHTGLFKDVATSRRGFRVKKQTGWA